jgi:exonuclease SbcD
MTRLLYTGDWHLRGTNPRNRTDNYKEAIKSKLYEIMNLAKYKNAEAIITAGDTFHTPEVSISVLLEFAEILKESPVPIYTTVGNHDVYSYNLDTYNRTSLRLLELLVPQLTVITDPWDLVALGRKDQPVALSFQPYTKDIDKDGYGYSQLNTPTSDSFRLHVAHGMLLDHTPPFDRFTLIEDVQTTADLVLTGHDHTGYGIWKRADGKTFVNCGAICRLSASKQEIDRQVQVLLIDVRSKTDFDLELIPLQSAKPGDEILDRSRIEAEQQRQYAMEEFSTLIKASNGQKVIVDINGIIEAIAEKEAYTPDIVRIALDKIAEAKEGLRL